MGHKYEIKNLKELLQRFFNETIAVTQCSIKPFTTAGENYGSQMLGVEVLFQKHSSKEDVKLNLVAKMCPPNEWIKEMFHTNITFKKEIAMYKTIFPTLKAFQKDQGISQLINCFPVCYGARVSLNSETAIDDDAVLLLENLKLSGYEVVHRMKGFDLEMTRLLMQNLAVFHAVPIGLKLLKPDLFKEKILPHLDSLQAFDNLSDGTIKSLMDMIIKTAKLNEKCVPLIPDIVKALEYSFNNLINRPLPGEPFATIVHNDYWVNNTMIKFEDNKPVHNKMIDFQLIDYGSPGNDIVFFLFSNVQKQVLDSHYDSFLKLYYNKFISTLAELKCNTEPFSFKLLLEEIDVAAKTMQFFHVLDMLLPICANEGEVKELSEMTEEDLITDDQVTDLYRQRVPETILEFVKRKWI